MIGVDERALVAIQYWLGIDVVAVDVVNNHEQLVSPVGLHWEMAGLVRVQRSLSVYNLDHQRSLCGVRSHFRRR